MIGALYSINRPHTDNIKSGLKLWEIRKSKPNIPIPFPAFIYETKRNGGCSKVIGEFMCDNIVKFNPTKAWKYYGKDIHYLNTLLEYPKTCLHYNEIEDYGKGKPLYGLHISNLKIYDKPKEINEFRKLGKEYHDIKENEKRHLTFIDGYIEGEPLTRPPQSMCYVEI